MSGFINDHTTVHMLQTAMNAKAIPYSPRTPNQPPQISMLGYGLPGGTPPGGLIGGGGGTYGGTGMEGGSTRGRDRKVLRKAFGRFKPRPSPRIITPFRQAYTAGDVAGTVNDRTLERAPNQVNSIAPVSSLRRYLHTKGAATGGKSLFTGNPRYVYDSSDYVRYRKLLNKNKNYNDLSFGGDESNASQVSIMRHF
tara:strand:+ start:686 stop:1273 length:588 start_codon:yes stop_codon:yes gene_type:complete